MAEFELTAPIAYIVAPAISDPRQNEKRDIVLSACAEAGFTARYPIYSVEHSTFDLSLELAAISAAALAFVDVSFERPSCYYELGIIEALRCPVILVAEEGTLIHQTSYRDHVQFYDDLARYHELIRSALGGGR